MKLRVLIAEDELLCRERLRQFLEAEDIEIVAECATGQQALASIRQMRPQIAFMDVRMPDLTGFEVIEALDGTPLPVIVFVTAYDRFALEAFNIHAADYLLKPFDRDRFRKALQRARERLLSNSASQKKGSTTTSVPVTPKSSERLTVKSQGRICLVNVKEINWIRSADNYVELHTASGTHLLRGTISALIDQLPAHIFVRISRSLVVNLDSIKEILTKTHGDYLVLMHDGTRLQGSRMYRQPLIQ